MASAEPDEGVTVCSDCNHGGVPALLVATLPDEDDGLAVRALACAARIHSGADGPVTVHKGPVAIFRHEPVDLRAREWAVTCP